MNNTLIIDIKENSKLSIKGKEYFVKSKVCYYTEKYPNNNYFKLRCDKGMLLVISEDLNDIFIGYEINIEGYINFPSPDKIIYENEEYEIVTSDYQFVKFIEFGKHFEFETECRFMDYSNKEENKILSIGIDTFNNKRDDVFAEKISIDDIKIIK